MISKPNPEDERGLDPVDVILLQDRAFGAARIDIDLWLRSLHDPVRLLSDENPKGMMLDYAAVIEELLLTETAARADGIAKLRTRILTHLQPTEDLAIIASHRDRLSIQNVVLGTTSMTWTLTRPDGIWRISQIFFDTPRYSMRGDRQR